MFETQIKKAMRPSPHGLIVDFVEHDTEAYGQFVGLRFYSSQWLELSHNQRLDCIEYLKLVKAALEKQGVLVTLEPVSGDPDD